MRLSMWSSYLIELEPEEMVRTFVTHGWECAELSDEHARTLFERGDPVREGDAFKRFAADSGFSFPQGHMWLTADIAHPDETERNRTIDELKRWCDLFAAIGITAAVLHPGGYHSVSSGLPLPDGFGECNVDALRRLADHVAGSSVTLCMENIFPPLPHTLADMLHLIDAVDSSHLALCLDTGHCHMSGGNVATFVREAGPRLKALHVTDSIADHDDHLLPYGGGNIAWPELVQALRDTGYGGIFNLEVPRENRCPMEIRLAKLDYAHRLLVLMTRGNESQAARHGLPAPQDD